jgi:hypothetical protein
MRPPYLDKRKILDQMKIPRGDNLFYLWLYYFTIKEVVEER